jgi:hypothetical protein
MANIVTRKASQVVTFNSMVVGAITLIIGVLVFNQVETSLPTTTGGIDQAPIISTIGSAFELAPIVLVVLVASLILAQVSGFRST